jgi:hypothetical protein
MPYRFERTDIAVTPDQLTDLLPTMARRQYEITQYIAVQCYIYAAGPPMPLGLAAPWHDDFNPDQLCLPFKRFIPVEVQSIYDHASPGLGDGWVICHTQNRRTDFKEILFNPRQTFAPDRILSLSVFRRVEAAPRPFVRGGGLSPSPRRSHGGMPFQASRELIELAARPEVRRVLLLNVGSLAQIRQEVGLDENGNFFSILNGGVVATLIGAAINENGGYIKFTVGIRDRVAQIRVSLREISQMVPRGVEWH